MSPLLDQVSLQFAICSRKAKGRPTLDIGCGDGVATVAALTRGAHVVAVDPDEKAVLKLLARVPHEQRPRLRARQGSLPSLDFKMERFAAVHAARVFHELDGPAVQTSLRKFFRWLYPGGRLFISAYSPAGACWEPFHAEYARRCAAELQWPGYIKTPARYFAGLRTPKRPIHLLDEHILQRELHAAGFVVENAESYPLPWNSEQICSGVMAHCGS